MNIKLVPSYANSFFMIYSRNTSSSEDINLRRNRLKMIWIAARSYSAKMIKVKSFWNFTFNAFVGKAMRRMPYFVYCYLAVIVCRNIPRPNPASWRLQDLAPESLFKCSFHNTKL